jgi:CYTH domain-containing protein
VREGSPAGSGARRIRIRHSARSCRGYFAHCTGRILEKTRHYVPGPSGLWEIDVYHDVLDGIVIAEIELDSETAPVDLPNWIGEKITGDPRYSKTSMLEAVSPTSHKAATRVPCNAKLNLFSAV